jgi:hypothetical protein
MPSQNRGRSAHRSVPQQIDLFAAGNAPAASGIPVWSGLPKETQATLTTLMTRLILDHAANRRIVPQEDGHDF